MYAADEMNTSENALSLLELSASSTVVSTPKGTRKQHPFCLRVDVATQTCGHIHIYRLAIRNAP